MTTDRKILVTSALPYANGPLHLGHLLGYIQADIWVRTQKMLGQHCLYVCGSDSHGTPIMIQAEKLNLTPEQMISQIAAHHQQDFTDFEIAFDHYHTTHSKENRELVNLIFERHKEAGNIVKHEIKQLFDPIKQLFLPDRYIKGQCPNCKTEDQYGDNCEVCGATYTPIELINPYSTLSGAKPIEKTSEHYFFKLQNFADFLKHWTAAGHLQTPVSNKLDEWFQEGLKEWDISRDAPYFGFLIPGETNKYFYVWLDAPVGYMASFKHLCAEHPEINFDEYWQENSKTELYHFIGKDIIYFHALFWPAILKGANFRTPTAIFANGFLTIDGQKMSKSRGTFIKARTYLNHFNPAYLRYYFAAKLNNRLEDLDINFDDFIQRINADLVGKFVNIASRCMSFITKHYNGMLATEISDPSLYEDFSKAGNDIIAKILNLEYSHAIRQIMGLADRANQYIDEKKPWHFIKDPDKAIDVQTTCTMGINLFRILMIYLKPVLPEMAKSVEHLLNIPPLTFADKDKPLLNHRIQEFKTLIQRIDPKQLEEMKMNIRNETEASQNAGVELPAPVKDSTTECISIDDFNKIDLRIATIIEASEVEGADKLLRLKVDVGDVQKQVFAGIKSSYQPEDLIGRQVILVANLAPRKMRFGLSEGMVIVAKDPVSQQLYLVSPDPGAKPGMSVK
ncbi:MAG: methionine--tRNA ligase [Gammaproteobacteria bacterium]|nr:methionine--tRNA ligase [Gammaproteobacteria bacterium]